jgi:hypothetical protein
MTRADVARALARAGCEITVRDSCAGIGRAIGEFDLIVTEVVDVAIEELVETFVKTAPPCSLIAWTTGIDSARSMLDAAGLPSASVVFKESRPEALVAAVRASIGDLPSIARG